MHQSDGDKVLTDLRSQIEQRVKKQVERHARVNPNFNQGQVVEKQFQFEKERLEKIVQSFEDDGDHVTANLVQELIEFWLPDLKEKLVKR